MIKQPEMRTVALADMDPAPYNPRTISDRARKGLRHSLKKFGLVQPIIWNEQTGHIVGGHQRYDIMVKDRVKETEAVVVDLTLEEEKALNLALNNQAIAGEFTPDVASIIGELEALLPDAVLELCLDDILDQVGALTVDEEIPYPEVPDGERSPFEEMTFVLTHGQAKSIKSALKKAIKAGDFEDTGSDNSNGNALHRIAEAYLARR